MQLSTWLVAMCISMCLNISSGYDPDATACSTPDGLHMIQSRSRVNNLYDGRFRAPPRKLASIAKNLCQKHFGRSWRQAPIDTFRNTGPHILTRFVDALNGDKDMVSIEVCYNDGSGRNRFLTTDVGGYIDIFKEPNRTLKDRQSWYAVQGTNGSQTFSLMHPSKPGQFLAFDEMSKLKDSVHTHAQRNWIWTKNQTYATQATEPKTPLWPYGILPLNCCVDAKQLSSFNGKQYAFGEWQWYFLNPSLNGSKEHVSIGLCRGDVKFELLMWAGSNTQARGDGGTVWKGGEALVHPSPLNSDGSIYWNRATKEKRKPTQQEKDRASFKVAQGPAGGNTFAFLNQKGEYWTGIGAASCHFAPKATEKDVKLKEVKTWYQSFNFFPHPPVPKPVPDRTIFTKPAEPKSSQSDTERKVTMNVCYRWPSPFPSNPDHQAWYDFRFVKPLNGKAGMVSMERCQYGGAASWFKGKEDYASACDRYLWKAKGAASKDCQSWYVKPGTDSDSLLITSDSRKGSYLHNKNGMHMPHYASDKAGIKPFKVPPGPSPWGVLPMGRCVRLRSVRDDSAFWLWFYPALNGSKDHISIGDCAHRRHAPFKISIEETNRFSRLHSKESVTPERSLTELEKERATFRLEKGLQPVNGNTFSIVDWQGKYFTRNVIFASKATSPMDQTEQSYAFLPDDPLPKCSQMAIFTPPPTPAPPTVAPTPTPTPPPTPAALPTPKPTVLVCCDEGK